MYICKDCFADEELRSKVASSAEIEGICDACGTTGKLMNFAELHDFFDALLLLFTPSKSGNSTIVDIIQDEWRLFRNKDVAKTLLSDVMDTHKYDFSINTVVDYTDEIKERIAVWDNLKNSVKEKSRFFTNMDDFSKYDYLTPGKSLRTGEKLYRSRITPVDQKKIKCDKMGCPPKEFATAGRANPIGIPYLYLSDTAKTTYFEVRAVYLDRLSVGTFRIEKDLKLIDFVYDINLYLSYTYNEDSDSLKEPIIKKKVIDAISEDLSKPLRRYDSELEYVPTQLVCEYCKLRGADGITFKSSLYKGGRNYVLFDGSVAKCTRVDIHEISSIDIDRK